MLRLNLYDMRPENFTSLLRKEQSQGVLDFLGTPLSKLNHISRLTNPKENP